MLRIRKATAVDSEDMIRIQRDSLQLQAVNEYSPEQLAYMTAVDDDRSLIPPDKIKADNYRYIVAEQDGLSVGYGSLDIDKGLLAATFVDPSVARQGIGRTIAEELQSIAQDNGIHLLKTYASLNAAGFYEQLGFQKQDCVDVGGESGPDIPSVLMEKQL
ncbi:GNAT family N-acetyltransferase [Natrialba taiwanensis]|uniref:GNAT family N-acetyltransferase n=1 Tax=Natrialba taiwanensis TaxID=160846 RepID=UPI00195546D0|nr:GNAT family N-acetyltransferase [Natrialba taiwanensis]